MSKIWLSLIGLITATFMQAVHYDALSVGNPIIPGYFADPTVMKFGDTYYIYATTDGNGGGLGPSQVWTSKDFVNWTIMPMNWPNTHYIWAPDVMQGKDKKYYMFYCQPCQIYAGVSDTPRGPWKNILGKEEAVLIPDRFVTNAITLDGQTFVDDDGSTYIYFGTWGIYKGFGCGVAKFTPDFKGFTDKKLIENTEITDFFEAPFVIKKDGVYYFTYSSGSCHDHTYRVQYAVSTDGPMGPFKFADNNPILATNADSTIHGPGHHSILKEGDNYYIVYHRHNLPGSTRGMHRQIAVDKLEFGPNHTIKVVEAGHIGIGALAPLSNPYPNLALNKPISVSSYYDEKFRPEYANDDNNATLWRPKSCGEEWILIDLQQEEEISRVWTQFEYATSFYQYLIETSTDGKTWHLFSDKRQNKLSGSPMVDYGTAKARYVRLTVTGNEKNGLQGAVWNIKVFGNAKMDPPQKLIHTTQLPNSQCRMHNSQLEISENQQETIMNCELCIMNCQGMLGGELIHQEGAVSGIEVPATLAASGFTLSFNFAGGGETLLESKVELGIFGNLIRFIPNSIRKMADGNHRISFASDGKQLSVRIDNNEVALSKIKTDAKASPAFRFKTTAGVTQLRLYNWKQEPAEINFDFEQGMTEAPQPAPARMGLLIDITADEYNRNDVTGSISNHGLLKGHFEMENTPLQVELKGNRKAFAFDDEQRFVSSFALPETMMGNAPYSVEAWVMNPEQSELEVLIDLTDARGELERIGIGVGKDRNAGIVGHNGSYEDMGSTAIQPDNQWHHLVVTFDGFIERIYWDGRQIKAKDVVLRLPKPHSTVLGQMASGEGTFSGWLHSLKVYDTPLTPEEVMNAANVPSASTDLFLFTTAGMPLFQPALVNEGAWGGTGTAHEKARPVVQSGLLAWKGAVTFREVKAVNAPQYISLHYFCNNTESKLLQWEGFELEATGMDVILKTGNRQQRFERVLLPKEWVNIVIDVKQKRLFITKCGQHKADNPMPAVVGKSYLLQEATIPLPQVITVGDSRTGKESFIQSLSLSISQPPVDRIDPTALSAANHTIHATLLTPNRVNIEVRNSDGSTLTADRSIAFRNHTTGTYSQWGRGSLSDITPAPNQTNHYTVWLMQKRGEAIEVGKVSVSTKESNLIDRAADLQQLKKEVSDKGSIEIKGNEITLQSTDSHNLYNSKDCGPALYADIVGDFVATVEVKDFTGMNSRRAVGFNEGGLIVKRINTSPEEDKASTQDMITIGIFPHYNVGNILSNVSRNGRPQFSNKKGWELDRYLQIERRGECFIVRTGSNGIEWRELQGSPVIRPDLNDGKPLRVGIYQTMYSDGTGYVTYENLHIWQSKP